MSEEQKQQPEAAKDEPIQTPPTPSVTDKSEDSLETTSQSPQTTGKEKLSSSEPKSELMNRLLPILSSLGRLWDGTLTKVRSLLPAAWNEKLSDWMLTGAIASVVVVILWTTLALLPKTPAEVAQVPADTINSPQNLEVPQESQLVESEPIPTPELTPEQSLIVAIQNQIAGITAQYGNDLIQAIEANFLRSMLLVKVSDEWYQLNDGQQNTLAQRMLSQSQELDFSKLEITDLEGTLVARSPVVGSSMVIFTRH
ncbi:MULTISPECIES: hypothetical protein [unclassified Moorena]|uniref:hypothetical protein n=1 Tax=unclassified Moorena TaxID=2683338 RepID=UPI0013FFAB7A|nr:MULTISPECIES: hypothetical protein [unclassified Moorena]NEO11138.1 hypothetical protein [Moorena sp. SIO3E8]NEP98046.1 hypothetical protein [Moorena sp. SIO3F7]